MVISAAIPDKKSSVKSLTPSAMSLDVMSSKPPHTSDIFSSTKTLAQSSTTLSNTHHTSISLITKTSNHSSSLRKLKMCPPKAYILIVYYESPILTVSILLISRLFSLYSCSNYKNTDFYWSSRQLVFC